MLEMFLSARSIKVAWFDNQTICDVIAKDISDFLPEILFGSGIIRNAFRQFNLVKSLRINSGDFLPRDNIGFYIRDFIRKTIVSMASAKMNKIAQ